MPQYTQLFTNGVIMTIELTLISVAIGAVLGLIVALMKMSSVKVISFIGSAYVEIIRGTPLLVQILIIYNGLPQFGIKFPGFIVGIIALSMNSAGYVAEIIRSGIQAVDPGQMEASRSKNILPALGNEFVVMLKESSIVSVIGFADLTRQAEIVSSVTYRAFEPLIIIAAIYFIMTLVFSRLLSKFERRLRSGDTR